MVSDSESDISIESLHEINSSDYEAIGDAEKSDTVWLDDDVTSTLEYGKTQITRQCTVDAVEYVSGLPSYWPIPRDKRAYIINLSDPKFEIKDDNGKLKTIDYLIKNQVSCEIVPFTILFISNLNRIRILGPAAPEVVTKTPSHFYAFWGQVLITKALSAAVAALLVPVITPANSLSQISLTLLVMNSILTHYSPLYKPKLILV